MSKIEELEGNFIVVNISLLSSYNRSSRNKNFNSKYVIFFYINIVRPNLDYKRCCSIVVKTQNFR